MSHYNAIPVGYPSSTFPPKSLILPPELDIRTSIAVNVYKPVLPQNAASRDIIFLAEFSEIEGPVPLLTIPSASETSLDFNDFVVKVMSTDYQNTSGEFHVCEDTQLVQEDIEPGVHVYVHYFTLYDVRARGFVRPMCLAYITYDARKLTIYFDAMRKKFLETTRYLKLSNLERFFGEMGVLISNLEYTKHRYIQLQRKKNHAYEHMMNDCSKDKNNHDYPISNVYDYSTINDYDNYPGTSNRCDHMTNGGTNRKADCIRCLATNDQEQGILLPNLNINNPIDSFVLDTKEDEPNNKTCYRTQEMKDKVNRLRESPFNATQYKYLDREELEEAEETKLRHTSLETVANQLLECQHIKEKIMPYLDNEEIKNELAALLEQVNRKTQSPLYKAMTDLGIIHSQELPPSNPVICVMSLMKREFHDMRCVHVLCGVGFVAALVKLKSIYKQFSRPTLTLIFEDLDRDLHDNPFGSLFIGNVPVVNVLKSYHKSQTKDNYSYSELCWDPEFVSFLYPKVAQPLTIQQDNNNILSIKTVSDSLLTLESDPGEISAADDCLEVFPIMTDDCVVSGSSDSENEEQSSRVEILPGPSPCNDTSSGSSYSSGFKFDITSYEEVEEEEGVGEDTAATVDDQGRIYFDVDSRMLMSKKSHLSSLVQQFCGVSHCLVHSLLSGRPVVLSATEKYRALVVLYVRALSTLMPREPGSPLAVLRWHTGTVTPFHLQQFKIVGLCIPERLHVQDLMSNATLNQVTVLNIESGHISGVAYGGTLVRGIENYGRRLIRSDASLQTVLQSMLVSLGLKVYLLYHLRSTTNRKTNDILKAIGVSKGDWDIVKYLAELLFSQKDNFYKL